MLEAGGGGSEGGFTSERVSANRCYCGKQESKLCTTAKPDNGHHTTANNNAQAFSQKGHHYISNVFNFILNPEFLLCDQCTPE